jgi:UDP-glucose 4-epimerase
MGFSHYFLVGGAGFIGSHFVDALLAKKDIKKVTIYDNFSSGREWHFKDHLKDPRFSVINADVRDLEDLKKAMQGHEVVMHFASNPDIALASTNPGVDFTNGAYLTFHVLEAARMTTGVKRILYMSGSGIYGDIGTLEAHENHGPLIPISTYGASKLFGEALISSYCHMFNLSACIFRFANVVGPRQTHGVGYDFIKKLFHNPHLLTILGNGEQSKSYIHISDVVEAVLLANECLKTPYEVYNVATDNYITVKEIADIIIRQMPIKNKVQLEFTGGDRGWKGDIPIVRLNTHKIRSLGWKCVKDSIQAIQDSAQAMLHHIKEGYLV